MRTRVVLLTVVALALLGAACTSSSGSDAATTTGDAPGSTGVGSPTSAPAAPVPAEEDMAYVDSLVTGLTVGDAAQGQLVMSDDQATCFARRWVAIVTPEGFAAAGIPSSALAETQFDYRLANLSEGQAIESVDGFAACDVDVTAGVLVTLTTGMDAATATCVRENIDAALVTDLLVSAFTPDLDNQAAFTALGGALSDSCDLN